MKISNEQIRKIIKEEISSVIDEVYYDSLGDVENYKDADELIGQRLWAHTNRTNRNQKKNGMIGLYGTNKRGNRTGSPLYYTNCIRLGAPIVFQTSEEAAKKIQQTGHRVLIAGVSGVVLETREGEYSGFVEAIFNPFGENKYFHPVDDPKRKLTTAEEVYFEATEEGEWKLMVKLPEEEKEIVQMPLDFGE